MFQVSINSSCVFVVVVDILQSSLVSVSFDMFLLHPLLVSQLFLLIFSFRFVSFVSIQFVLLMMMMIITIIIIAACFFFRFQPSCPFPRRPFVTLVT